MPTPPLHLDHSLSTFLVLSVPSPTSPLPPSSSLPASLRYVGALGEGLLASEHVYALPHTPEGPVAREEAERVGRELERLVREEGGIGRAEVMESQQRSKR
ncbi:hypothetical protein JCM10207_001702 [Rhodosporidiobolus poonsookiae]